MKKLIFGKL